MKKLILFLTMLLVSSSAAYAAERSDPCEGTDSAVRYSENIVLISNNPANFQNDTSRLATQDMNEGFLVYKLNGAKQIKFTMYSDSEVSSDNIDVALSEDDENYTSVEIFRNSVDNKNVGYTQYDVIVKTIPEGCEYVKLTFKQKEKLIKFPQLGAVIFSDEEGAYDSKGLLFVDEFNDKTKMYHIGANWKFEGGRALRLYDIRSAIKYKIKSPKSLTLRYRVMDNKGEVKVWASSYDGGYVEIPITKAAPVHVVNNWHQVDITADDFPADTEFIMLDAHQTNHACWPPSLDHLEVYY